MNETGLQLRQFSSLQFSQFCEFNFCEIANSLNRHRKENRTDGFETH